MSVAMSQIWPAPHVVVPRAQRVFVSSQVSTPLQATPSEQLRAIAPTHVALAVHASSAVQKSPSLHAAPVFGDQALADVAGRQIWHTFVGLVVIGA